MDGASHYFLRKVVIPMSMPIIVTVSLFALFLLGIHLLGHY